MCNKVESAITSKQVKCFHSLIVWVFLVLSIKRISFKTLNHARDRIFLIQINKDT